jgi:protoporphyrinogen oxidase/cytochrome b involved in lipid metabolism
MSETNKKKYNSPEYDYIIVGAGIAGLYTAFQLHNKKPNAKIAILEATNRVGGRLHSLSYDGVTVDAGGARFNTDQHRILCLIKELKLVDKVIPIKSDINYIDIDPQYDTSLERIFPSINEFILYMQKYIHDNKISNTILINTTILEFVDTHFSIKYPTLKTYLTDICPYYSELAVLNALEAIKLFTNEFSPNIKYMILMGGLAQLTSTLYDKLKNTVTIHLETPLDTITKLNDASHHQNHYTYTLTSSDKQFKTSNIILAIPKNKLLDIKYLTTHKNVLHNINSVQTEPLYRIYARYPIDKTTHKVWFDGIQKIATNLPIKYIIPYNYDKGVIMISYTDNKFAKYWMDHVSNGTFETTLKTQLKQLFPNMNIPSAKWYKHCYWDVGAGYWKPGYDRMKIMHKMIKPLPNENIFICGENYSSHQAWVEGALETADLVMAKLGFAIKHKKHCWEIQLSRNSKQLHSNGKTQKIMKHTMKHTKKHASKHSSKTLKSIGRGSDKEYTLADVAKHNKKTDGWIVVDGIVADVTKWIPKHPGGDIIMKGVGKDATKLFHGIGHDEYAKKMLKKYKIGVLKH